MGVCHTSSLRCASFQSRSIFASKRSPLYRCSILPTYINQLKSFWNSAVGTGNVFPTSTANGFASLSLLSRQSQEAVVGQSRVFFEDGGVHLHLDIFAITELSIIIFPRKSKRKMIVNAENSESKSTNFERYTHTKIYELRDETMG